MRKDRIQKYEKIEVHGTQIQGVVVSVCVYVLALFAIFCIKLSIKRREAIMQTKNAMRTKKNIKQMVCVHKVVFFVHKLNEL